MLPAPLLSPLLWQQQLVGCKGDRLCLLTHLNISAQSWGNLSLPQLSPFRAGRRERGASHGVTAEGIKRHKRVVEPRWTRDQGWAVWGCGEQMVMGAGEGVGWPRMPGEACIKQPVEGRGEESDARGGDPIKESAGAASSQIQQRSLLFPFVTLPGMGPT